MRYICTECKHEQFVPTRPIVAVDVDGTLADYHKHFLRFAEGYCHQSFPPAGRVNPGLPLHEFMGLEKSAYDEVKFAYRRGGMKRTMPVINGAAEMTWNLKELGCEVWISTTRPADRYDNVDPDTREWLRRNGIHYDALIFDSIHGDDKYSRLSNIVGADSVVAMIDDLPEMIDVAKDAGIENRFLYTQPYNMYREDGFTRINSLLTFPSKVEQILEAR